MEASKITKEEILIWEGSNSYGIFSEEKEEEICKLERDFENFYFDAKDEWEKTCEDLTNACVYYENANQAIHVIASAECNAWETYTAETYLSDDYEEYLRKLFVRVPKDYPDNVLNPNDPVYYKIATQSMFDLFNEYPNVGDAYYNFQEREK